MSTTFTIEEQGWRHASFRRRGASVDSAYASSDNVGGLDDGPSPAVPSYIPPSLSHALNVIPTLKCTQALVRFWGYPCEMHTVTAADGYQVSVFRIPYSPRSPSIPQKNRCPVIVWHGLAISSSAFVCSPGGPDHNLALLLADRGYDVWLANSRGNMFSRSHRSPAYSGTDGFLFHLPCERRYWSRVGMDEIARWDVPAVVKYVCERSQWKKCVYIGYSQGTAQMVMSASLSEEVQERVGLFIGLAPALCPKLKGLGHHLSPNHMRILGSGSFLPHAVMRAVIPHSVYAAMVHGALQFVTGWKCTSYPKEWHTALYTHLYGGGSVRNFIHWFQVATNESFAPHQHHDPYEFEECIQGKESGTSALVVSALKSASTLFSAADELLLPIATNSTLPFVPRHTPPPSYPTHHLHMPTLLFAGSDDNLSDVRQLRKCFSTNVEVRVVDGYGHMDFLWAVDAEKMVWNDIVSAIEERM